MVRRSRTAQPVLPLWDSQSKGSPATRTRRSFRTVGLFAGVGGLELGLQKAGHETSLLCEIEPSARAVLAKRFPGVPVHDDVCTLKSLPKGTELLVAGFPCQDLSQAGQTRGIEGSRSGLVGEVFRLVRKQRVPWLVLENVPFMLQLAGGEALEVIVAALEDLGYRWAYRVVDTRAFGLPQRRRRVIMVASLEEDPRTVLFGQDAGAPEEGPFAGKACGFYWTEGVRGLGWAIDAVPTLKGGSTVGVPSPPAIWMPDGRIVTPDLRDAERLQGFLADWTKPAEAVVRASFRWKLVGNAVSVPVAKWLGDSLAKPRAFSLEGVRDLTHEKAWPTNAWNVGAGRFTADMSEYPVQRIRKSLESFLREEPKLLSPKATAGFLARMEKGNLRFPPGFMAALRAHLRVVAKAA
jgi:DNA (cytosine-5)-methyltransferase 1